jgi:uroporphyrinogen-III synthase
VTTLAGRRVVVTRSLAQAAPLVELLRAAGAEPVMVPLIDVTPTPDAEVLAGLDLDAYDWVLVTSPNGADALHATHRAPARARVGAVGRVTAARLERCDLVPERHGAEGLLEALDTVSTRDGGGDRSLDVLVVQAVDAAPTLADGLRRRGHRVTAVAPYRSHTTVPDAAAGRAVADAHAVLFASGSAGRAWVEVFGTATPPCVVAIGPQTAADLTACGLKVTVVAADHDAAGLVAALEQCPDHLQ